MTHGDLKRATARDEPRRAPARHDLRAPGLDAPPAPFIGGDPQTRARIRSEARSLFERFGYSKTTIGEIAEACRMSPANLYRHFRNKQAIGHAVVGDFVSEQAAAVQQALDAPAPSTEARLRAATTAQIMATAQRLRETPRLIELAEMIFTTEEGRALIERMERESEQLMATLVQMGVEAGEFAQTDAPTAARAVKLCLLFFSTPFGMVRRGLDTVEEDAALALDLICAGLRCGCFAATARAG